MNSKFANPELPHILADALLKIKEKTGEELIDVCRFVILHLCTTVQLAGVPLPEVLTVVFEAAAVANSPEAQQQAEELLKQYREQKVH